MNSTKDNEGRPWIKYWPDCCHLSFHKQQSFMKKLLFTILIAAPVLALAQDPKASNLKIEKKPQQYSCRELELTPNGKVMTLRKNVEIETENLILRADSAVFTNENQTWLAYGTKELIFKGPVMAHVNPETIRFNNNIIRYKLGDKNIYFE